ncbi:MAG: ABC transporter permease subunit [Alphaproteobacteria bacterium]|nr:ABC transporter permease subunit [Alphaproteobacteria bacterium]
MLRYVVRRVLMMVPTLVAISFIVFVIIQLPEGDYLDSLVAELEAQGEQLQSEQIEYLREQYGLDEPLWRQYVNWISGIVLRGDFGYSFEYQRPVFDIIGERFLLTAILAAGTILFTWMVAFPIAIYSAVYKYSWGDHFLTFLGFLGLATPNFLLALILLYLSQIYFGTSVGQVMAEEYLGEPMSLAKLGSIIEHMWVAVVVIGTAGTASMIRRIRANLLDELEKPYVVTARAKGLPPGRALVKYPLRLALNPFVSDIGNLLPELISGSVLVAFVLSIPTNGPVLVNALQSQDMYLAGGIVMLEAVLVVIGVLISDLALAALDPRIRLGAGVRR